MMTLPPLRTPTHLVPLLIEGKTGTKVELPNVVNLGKEHKVGEVLTIKAGRVRLMEDLGGLDCFPGGTGVKSFRYEKVEG